MALERTLSIIKPDAVGTSKIGAVISRLEAGGLRVIAARMVHLTERQAQEFYAVHKGRPFYQSLVSFMTSGPVLAMILEGDNAIARNRDIMGATDPKKAAPGTIRADMAQTIEENVVHGSDGPETAKMEMSFFFSQTDICPLTR